MRWYSAVGALGALATTATAGDDRPNILFILTDDQDSLMDSLDFMPSVQKHIAAKGVSFERHYCTVSLCCPSRVNLWTGQLAHNTNVTNVKPPGGGYPKIVENGYNDENIHVWMQQSGYNTYYTGKLYNFHNTTNYNKPAAKGFNESEFLLDPYTYQYYNFTSTRNAEEPINRQGIYSPDHTAETAYEFLSKALEHKDRPFFLTASPVAPHCEGSGFGALPPQCAERHKDLFKDYKIPRTPNFNPDDPSGVSWVAEVPKLNETEVAYNDEYQRQRLRALQSVDEMVEKLVSILEEAGQLQNTHIIFSSDNGYHISQHRLHPGKMLSFEEDVRIPFIWRGPGIPEGETRSFPTSHTDLAPTILKIAGLPTDGHSFDGLGINIDDTVDSRTESVGMEFWGYAIPETPLWRDPNGLPPPETGMYLRNNYKALRIEAEHYSFYYSVWCTNEAELYDMQTDPSQMHSLLKPGYEKPKAMGRDIKVLRDRLDALMLVLKSCKGETCTYPWQALHPDGSVKSLKDALSQEYDDFYQEQPKVSFEQCISLYIPELEGPQEYNQFEQGALQHQDKRYEEFDWAFWE